MFYPLTQGNAMVPGTGRKRRRIVLKKKKKKAL